ncbi:hypothetical protein FD09_GL000408 [Schleiferilactobacillus perolens DSM 12744]|uniref:Uncharacterized protein n=1 Tax=Schleiferilactobacillus perolens DSM 12744 TaxID=1423792 RepID=A0A0R1N3H1_9LACO|nr:hypothetical protein FD09_GL000408 [Schleiferilactobacillus perolens DSM 12744]
MAFGLDQYLLNALLLREISKINETPYRSNSKLIYIHGSKAYAEYAILKRKLALP